MRLALCHENELEEGHSLGFSSGGLSLFIVKKDNQIYAYENRCPHLKIELEWMPDQFMDSDRDFIQCSTHGALFLPDTGLCISGPCLGDKLTAIPVILESGTVHIELSEQDESTSQH